MAQNEELDSGRYHRAKQWEIAFFSLNNSATNIYLFAFGFLTYYATGIAGLLTVTVSSLLGAARLFDGIIDPTIGVMMDRINTKWGKFRPIMLLSNIGLILSFFMIFNVHRFDGALQMVVFLIALVFHKIVYSFQQTVTKAAQPALTNDPKQRPLFSVYDTVFSSIGIFAVMQVVVSNFLSPRHNDVFDLGFFREFLTIVIVISAVYTILAMIGISRKDNIKYFGLGEDTVETKSLKDYWSVLKGNTPLIILSITAGVMKFTQQLMGDQAFLVMLFGIVLGNYGLSGVLSTWQIIPNLLIVVLLTRVASNRDLKSAYKYSVLAALASILTMIIIIVTSNDPTQIFSNGGFLPILFGAAFIGWKTFQTYPTSIVLTMSADITDYETARSGRFVSGLIGTIFSLTDSIASSLAPIFIGFVVASIGYTEAYPQPTEALSPDLLRGTLIIMGTIAVIYFVALFLLSRYPLDQAAMEDIQAQISEKKSAGEVEEPTVEA